MPIGTPAQAVGGMGDTDKNKAAQEKLGATVVLKKHHTEIYTDDQVYQLPIGTPAQAVGGMGDTLAGMVGGFTAEFNEKADKAVLAAVYAHSAIAEKIAESQYIVLPHQISRALCAQCDCGKDRRKPVYRSPSPN